MHFISKGNPKGHGVCKNRQSWRAGPSYFGEIDITGCDINIANHEDVANGRSTLG